MKRIIFLHPAIAVSLLLALTVPPAAEAYSAADVAAVTKGQSCPHADLSGADLSGADLTGSHRRQLAECKSDRSQTGTGCPEQCQPAGLQFKTERFFRSAVNRCQFAKG